MKYPKQQFDLLVDGLNILKSYTNISEANPHTLHFEIFQNHSKSHDHNWLVVSNGKLSRKHTNPNGELLFPNKSNFLLYPDGCNDSHIETAVRKAISQIFKG